MSDDKTDLVSLMQQDGIRFRKTYGSIHVLCPFHDDRNPSCHVDCERGLYFCFGCGAKGDAVTYLEDKRRMSQKEALRMVKGDTREPPKERSEKKKRESKEHRERRKQREDLAGQFWKYSKEIPLDASHPVRKWAARRGIWHPKVSWPVMQRWVPALGNPDHEGAGSLIAAVMPFTQWRHENPTRIAPRSVHMIALTVDGYPCRDRDEAKGGLKKRTMGSNLDCCHVIGLINGCRKMAFCEGIADALALASTYPVPVAAMIGTASFKSDELVNQVAELQALQSVGIYRDDDETGKEVSRILGSKINAMGIRATVFVPESGGDPAERLGRIEFADVDEERLSIISEEAHWQWRYDLERQHAIHG